MTATGKEIAIVGMGPKGTYTLERLLEHIHRVDQSATGPHETLRITAYEPATPGSGPNYAPSQPSFLRMNFAASQVDAWPDDTTFVPRPERLCFVDWRSREGPAHGDDYPPRAQVGRYLEWCLQRMLAHRSKRVDWRLVPRHVTSLDRTATGWLVVCACGERRRFDEVIFCTGHRWKEPASPAPIAGAIPCVPVFPIDAVSKDHPLAPGTVVAVRGFALSFIDAALALTEGRGGVFVPGRIHPKLVYLPSGREPLAIVPFSRSGLPMATKPPPDLFRGHDEIETATTCARTRVLALEPGFSVEADLMPVVADLAHVIATATGARAHAPTSQVTVMIERSIAMAHGLTPPDHGACLGEAWRLAYPAVVERLGHGGLADDEYAEYRRVTRSMERIAFGPPPVNVAKLLALADAGIVDLERTGVAPGATIDGLVDAVLPGAGVDPADSGPLGALIRAGVLTREGRRGVRVDDMARCIGPDGRRVTGLACAGRPTEDWVIGNDTLSRRLHPEIDRWAEAVVGRPPGDAFAAPTPAAIREPVTGHDRT